MECKKCLFDSEIAEILADGECEYCKLHDRLENLSNPAEFYKILRKIFKSGKGKKYDCLIGISGGFDSSLLLEYTVKKWNLRPLVIHFDNHYNEQFAEDNISTMVNSLNVDFIRYQVSRKEYDECCRAFLAASVPDADIPNDVIMTKLMYETARKYGIKYILNGHCFRTEGSTPAKWTYMDAQYIRSVYKWHTGKETTLPLLTIRDQIIYGLLGIKQVRPFYYLFIDREKERKRLICEYNWTDYELKHGENKYTAWVGYYLLPSKFGIDKRRVYLSALIRSGKLTKVQAKEMLTPVKMDFSWIMDWIKDHAKTEKLRTHKDFKTYNFKKYRFVFWLLTKMSILPYTFYKKYCK